MNEKLLFCIIFIGLVAPVVICSAEEQTDLIKIEQFLRNDTTDQHKYYQYYSRGHFSRDLSRNASDNNFTIGSVILGNHPVFRGYKNHIMNYVSVNTSIWLIEPQNDQIMRLNDTMYRYYRLYPDGSQVPSNWKHNLAHTGVIL